MHHVDDVFDLLGRQLFHSPVLFKLFDLLLPFLDLAVQQFDAFTRVGGELHARMFDLHDDAVGLGAGQCLRGVFKMGQRLDRPVCACGQTVQVAVRGHVEGIRKPCIVAIAFAGKLHKNAMRGIGQRLIVFERVVTAFDELRQCPGETFLEDFPRQFPGQRIERGAEQRHVQLRIGTHQQTQHTGLIYRAETFHLRSNIAQHPSCRQSSAAFSPIAHCTFRHHFAPPHPSREQEYKSEKQGSGK